MSSSEIAADVRAEKAAAIERTRWFYAFLPNKVGSGATISLPPIYVTEILGGTVADVGVINSLTNAAAVPAAALWGWLSDRVGTRKHYLVLGFLGFAIPTILMGFSHSVWQFLLLSALVGALGVAGTPVSSTLIMDTTPRTQWDTAFGRFNQIGGWGMVAGRVVGLACVAYGIAALGNETTQRGLWMIGGGLGLASAVWAWRVVPEPRLPKPRPPRRPLTETVRYTGYTLIERMRLLPHSVYYLPTWNPVTLARIMAGRTWTRTRRLAHHLHPGHARVEDDTFSTLRAYFVVSFVLFLVGTMAYTPFAVWQREELTNSTSSVFLVGMMNSIAAALSYQWVGSLIARWGSLRVQMVTISLRIVVFGGFAVMSWLGVRGLTSIVVLIVLQSLSGLGWAGIAVGGNSTVAHLAPEGHEGAALGVYTSFLSFGAILGAFISGFVVLWIGYAASFTLGAIGVALVVLALWVIRRRAPADAREHL